MLTRKNYTALAAEMMGYETFPPEMEHGLLVAITEEYRMWWNPLQDRNQSYELLKRAEELGLADEVEASIYLRLKYLKGFAWGDLAIGQINWLILTCPTDIIVMACVDVWEAWQAVEGVKKG